MNESSTFEVAAEVGRKGTWVISLNANALTIAAADIDESIEIAKADAEQRIELRESRFTAPFLVASVQKKKVVFKLDRDQAASFKQWLGPPTITGLKVALKRRLRWSVPIGMLFVLASLPLPADPEAGLEAVSLDPVSAFFGVSLLGLSILMRVWCYRVLFLFDGIWFSLLAAHVALGIFRGNSPWWAIIVIILIMGAKCGFSEYKRFDSLSSG